MDKNDRIKIKINALLSKTTDNGATKEEMESALQKASELMLKYFISEHDLTDPLLLNKFILKEVALIKSAYNFRYFYNSLARLFDCEYYLNNYSINFFGFEQDTQFCEYFYNTIIKTCLNSVSDFKRSDDYKILKEKNHGRAIVSSFIKGFLIEISGRMNDLYENRVKEVPKAYGLIMLDKMDRVTEQFRQLKPNLTYVNYRTVEYEKIAFNAGLAAGKDISLTQGIEDYKTDSILKIGC